MTSPSAPLTISHGVSTATTVVAKVVRARRATETGGEREERRAESFVEEAQALMTARARVAAGALV